jgi:hypothetical protein
MMAMNTGPMSTVSYARVSLAAKTDGENSDLRFHMQLASYSIQKVWSIYLA